MSIPPGIRDLLACPRCHGALRDVREDPASEIVTALDCVACGLRYAVRDGIPVMLVDQATPIGPSVG